MIYTNSELRAIISEIIHSERDRAVLCRRLIDGIRFEALAEEFDLSVRHVKTIVYRFQPEIFARIQSPRL